MERDRADMPRKDLTEALTADGAELASRGRARGAAKWRGAAAAAAVAALGLAVSGPASASPAEQARWRREAAAVTITRDDWGVAHIHGRTDADAVFGMIYAEAEDDFGRIEANYLAALGRQAEADGEVAIWTDLRARLFLEESDLKAAYNRSPPWLRSLMNAWADGLNYYLATHRRVAPRVLRRFEPWMALSLTEGSFGGDIERLVRPEGIAAFYGHATMASAAPAFADPSGSNGIAIAPKDSATGHALLLINPHTDFYYRTELQVRSDEGLDAYGAATWGQFFIYQGFNAHAGWMHTSTGADNVDEFAESVTNKAGRWVYRYGARRLPVAQRRVTLAFRRADGRLGRRTFTTYRTRHGPVVREADGKWIAVALMNKPVAALEQSFLRTKARDYAGFVKVAGLKANASNNTVFADDKGEIAYLHPQFVPRRDDRFDYTRPVDGADPATDWKGLHRLSELPHVLNPSTGWLFNSNDWPYTAAGPDSPRRADFPKYMDRAGENARGLHMVELLTRRKAFTLDSLIEAAYDPHMTAFDRLVPGLVRAWERLDPADPRKARLAAPVALLGGWDRRWSLVSEPTSLAVFWGEDLYALVKPDLYRTVPGPLDDQPRRVVQADAAPDAIKIRALEQALDRLEASFGRWRVPWGEINRLQRLTDDRVGRYDDAKPSVPVPFTWSEWGSLAAFSAKAYPNTRRYYGDRGNSFVAAVEFGPRVRARAITVGGESGDPRSPHFDDQASRYASGDLRPVYFYPDDLRRHTERRYHPGQLGR